MAEQRKRLLASEARILFGLPPGYERLNAHYILWWVDVSAYMIANGIRNQTLAGTEPWKGVKHFAIRHWVLAGHHNVYSGSKVMAVKLDAKHGVLTGAVSPRGQIGYVSGD